MHPTCQHELKDIGNLTEQLTCVGLCLSCLTDSRKVTIYPWAQRPLLLGQLPEGRALPGLSSGQPVDGKHFVLL